MVVIISEDNDPSTDKVMDWLSYTGHECIRLNGDRVMTAGTGLSLHFGNTGPSVCSVNDNGELAQIDAVWFRRDKPASFFESTLSDINHETWYQDILTHFKKEHEAGKTAFYTCLSNSPKILGNYAANSPDKLRVLDQARKCKLDIPATLITNKKADLLAFAKKHGAIITKAVKNSFGFRANDNETYLIYTEVVTMDTINALPENFYYSLFQEKLEKELDIRVFFLAGKCHSMAIFSQLDPQTSVDFRKYNGNRNVPYRLPKETENSIGTLMEELELNTGSIDIVKTSNGRFVFLEVNPVGQYDMTGVPCNYHLDKKIAEYLTGTHEQ